MAKLLGLSVIAALLMLQFQINAIDGESIPICLSNCVQCKKMFGRFFQGRICGNDCISTNGLASPDCNNPITIGNYLKRFI